MPGQSREIVIVVVHYRTVVWTRTRKMDSVVFPLAAHCCYPACSGTTRASVAHLQLPRTRLHFPQQKRRFSFKVFAISSNDFRPGTEIELEGAPWRVIEFMHVKPGKGAAFVRTKLKNCITGNTVERTFRAGENVEDATVEKNVKQFTYREGDQYVFMDMKSFEESRLTEKEIGDKGKWLREGMDCNVLTWNGRVLDVEVPITVKYKVVQTEPGVKGNRESGGTKPATIDTGAQVNVPLFIDIGEDIFVDTRTGEYMSRAK